MNIIQTENLTKKFGDTIAVDNVSIHIKKGEIYGFLGLNGAGKTTTIRLLLGMIKPDSGSGILFNQKPKQASEIWNDIGYLVETPHSYPNLTVTENLEVIYRLRGLKNISLINEVIKKLQLTRYKDQKEKYLSLGNKQRLGLAKALIHRPKLLILDEPVNGLDPAGIVEIREHLKDLVHNHNTTVFLSSHILSEIAKLATRIGIIHEGKLIKEINTNELDRQIIKKLLINTINNEKAIQLLKNNGFNASINKDAFIETSDSKAIQRPEDIATFLVNSRVALKQLNVVEEDLESYFLRLIGNPTSEE
ncbi:MAG: bacitracin ABC transporter ATP-binding protein [Gammaproteobacteria bacterium SG8_11]|nr:MAG: bacitracin ABC transporter ATP-binding protein [Gammaproteobacteria bacterium SG8_11]